MASNAASRLVATDLSQSHSAHTPQTKPGLHDELRRDCFVRQTREVRHQAACRVSARYWPLRRHADRQRVCIEAVRPNVSMKALPMLQISLRTVGSPMKASKGCWNGKLFSIKTLLTVISTTAISQSAAIAGVNQLGTCNSVRARRCSGPSALIVMVCARDLAIGGKKIVD